MTKKHKSTTSTWTGKVGIILLWIWILAISIAGYSYYGTWSKSVPINTNQGESCPMMRNTTTQWWGWCGGGSKTTISTTPTNNTVDATNTYETMNIWHDAYSLIPETVNLTAGKNYKLIITPSADGAWCLNTMTFPWLDSNIYPVKNGTPITVVINNAKAGTYQVVCWAMWMHQGTIVIQ